MKVNLLCKQRPLFWSFWSFFILILISVQGSRAQGNISLTWDVEAGCKVFGEDPIKRIFLEDIANNSCLSICENQLVNYELTGNIGTIENVTWSTTGGTIVNQTIFTCQVDWGVTGFGVLTFNITFEDGSTLAKEFCVEKRITPTAFYTVFPFEDIEGFTGCYNQAITFTNQSTTNGGSALTYYWDFGDGTTSQEVSPAHTYTVGDTTYIVTLIVTNECGCTDKMTREVKIRGKGFDIECASVVCEGSRVKYSVPINPKEKCEGEQFWSVAGGTQVNISSSYHEIEVEWNNVDASGFGNVVFDGTSCDVKCPSVISIRVPVIKSEGTIVGESLICIGKQYRYTLPQWPTTVFNWSTTANSSHHELIQTDQRNEVILIPDEQGVIVLECHYFNTLLNCGGTAKIEINVSKVASISGELNLCEGKIGSYDLTDNNGNPLNGNWTLTGPQGIVSGIGSTFTYDFEDAGTYTLTASGEDFCTPDFITINIVPAPSIPLANNIAGDRMVCPGIPVNYYVINPSPGMVYSWEIASNGGFIQGSSYGNQVTVVFSPSASSYTLQVRAIQKESPNCASKRLNVTIGKIQPNFDIQSNQGTIVCASSTVAYWTTYSLGDIYNWRIVPSEAGSIVSGNGTASVEVLWNSYNGVPAQVFLDITQCSNITTEAFGPISIVLSPEISVSTNATVCKGQNFIVTINTVDIPINSISSIEWNFGNGETYTTTPTNNGTSFSLTTPYAYNSPITNNTDYTITATIYGANGCFAPTTASFTVTVLPSPNVSVTPNLAIYYCEEDDIDETFTVSIQTGVGFTTSVVWEEFDELGLTWSPIPNLSSNSLTYNATSFGSYSALVSNSNGCSTRTNPVSILQSCPSVVCTILPDPELSDVSVVLTGCRSGLVTINHAYEPISYEFECSGGIVYNVNQTATSTTAQVNFNKVGEVVVKFTAVYSGINGENCELEKTGSVLVPYRADLKYTATCGANNTYNISLLNHSEVYPGYTITSYSYYFNGTWHNNFATPDYTTLVLPPGNHNVGIRISDGVNAPCEKQMIIYLPQFPIASFTVDNIACPNTPLQFNANPIDVAYGCLFNWDFNDNSYNNLPNPEKSYSAGPREVTVTVTNTQGCSVVSDPINISIYNVELGGQIEVSPSDIVCEGTLITMGLSLGNSIQPSSYEWYSAQSSQVLATTFTFTPTMSGLYGLKLYDSGGCSKWILDWKSVTFLKAPIAHVNGPTAVCEDITFTLDGFVGGDTQYEWLHNGSVIGSDSVLNQQLDLPGVYIFTLNVSAPDGLGGYCSDTTQHTVTVFETPPPPIVSIMDTAIVCETYSIPLHAESFNNEPGHFSWSNGVSGSDIIVTHGGAYQVRYTDNKGCSVTSQLDIPKAPSYFNWVFPRGCYTFCIPPERYLIGPLEGMPYWAWQVDQSIQLEGTDLAVESFDVLVSGTYQFTLNTGLCAQTTEPTSISVEACKNCPIIFDLKLIEKVSYNGAQAYYIEFTLTNLSITDMWLNVQLGQGFGGTVLPSSFLLPGNANGATYSFLYIPDTNFTGGPFRFSLTEDPKCSSEVELELPNIDEIGKNGEVLPGVKTISFLYAAPNPVNDVTTVYYSFAAPSLSKHIRVYDVLGRPIINYEVVDAQGQQIVELSQFPQGYYVIVLECDGNVIGRIKILKK